MQADPAQTNLKEIGEWVNKLACPTCLGALRLERMKVVCASCGRIYPVVDGIPILIPDRATALEP
jgi:uncharacterized protein YbaR (Trm112 family)